MTASGCVYRLKGVGGVVADPLLGAGLRMMTPCVLACLLCKCTMTCWRIAKEAPALSRNLDRRERKKINNSDG